MLKAQHNRLWDQVSRAFYDASQESVLKSLVILFGILVFVILLLSILLTPAVYLITWAFTIPFEWSYAIGISVIYLVGKLLLLEF